MISGSSRSAERSAETDFVMFGYYIANNIGIGFRTFAGGILFGIGTLFLLVYNGLVIGGVAGHLTAIGYRDTFWSFVSAHGAFELTAIAVCGAAGLRLARAVLAPSQYSRARALALAGPRLPDLRGVLHRGQLAAHPPPRETRMRYDPYQPGRGGEPWNDCAG